MAGESFREARSFLPRAGNALRQDASVTPSEVPSVRGDHLASLLRRVRLSGREWAVVLTALLSPTPLTAREIARRTRLAYPHAKALVRALVAWRILRRVPGGVAFQPEAGRWGPPEAPATNGR